MRDYPQDWPDYDGEVALLFVRLFQKEGGGMLALSATDEFMIREEAKPRPDWNGWRALAQFLCREARLDNEKTAWWVGALKRWLQGEYEIQTSDLRLAALQQAFLDRVKDSRGRKRTGPD